MDIAEKLKNLRKEKGYTQKELADIVGTTQTTITNIEIGVTKNPKVDVALKIAIALDVNVYDLFGDSHYDLKNVSNDNLVKAEIEKLTFEFKKKLVFAADDFLAKERLEISRQRRFVDSKEELDALENKLDELDGIWDKLLFTLDKFDLLSNHEYTAITFAVIKNEGLDSVSKLRKFRKSLVKKS